MDRPNTGGKDTKKSRNKVEKNPNTGAKETYSPEKETYRPKRNVDCVRAVYTCTYMYIHVCTCTYDYYMIRTILICTVY